MDQPSPVYSIVSVALHWVIALLVFAQIGLIWAHEATHGQDVSRTFVMLHKSDGMLILLLTVFRILWRFKEPAIALPSTTPAWQRLLAHGVRIGFYAALILLPLLGWAAASAAARPLSFYGLFDWPALPVNGGRMMARQLMEMHYLGAKLLYVLMFLHIGAALMHQFVFKDDILRRMIPSIPPRP